MAMTRIRPGKYSMMACFITEVVMTMMFLFIIMGSTHGKAPAGFAPLAIGLALIMIHLVSIPVTNTSVNPARSTGPALFVGGWALAQLWLFWVAPLIGGVLGGVIYRWLSDEPRGVVEGLVSMMAWMLCVTRDSCARTRCALLLGGAGGDTSVTCPILRPGRAGPLP